MPPQTKTLQHHLAFEVYWLVYAAVRYREARGQDRVAFQDSAFLHARNLLEFTSPRRPHHGWWIVSVGGAKQPSNAGWRGWSDLINSKVTHLGDGRLRAAPWPVPEDDLRCIAMSHYFLSRVSDAAEGSVDSRMMVARQIATLGIGYLESPTVGTLKPLADLVG